MNIKNPRRKVLYIKYIALKYRCEKEKHPAYKWYGGRWIRCLWNNFEDFLLDMDSTFTEWMTIDRKNNDWDYCKDNCRWITMERQCNNRNTNRKITYNGITKNFGERAKEFWINRTTLQWRLSCWWSLEKAFSNTDYRRKAVGDIR